MADTPMPGRVKARMVAAAKKGRQAANPASPNQGIAVMRTATGISAQRMIEGNAPARDER